MDNAQNDIIEKLRDDEIIEAVVFGPWGWDGYGEPDPAPVPESMQGRLLPWNIARTYMQNWSFYGGFGAPECYAVYIWTSERVFWVTQYDGATSLSWAPRWPQELIPDMPGG